MTPEKLRENIQIVRLAAGDARAKSDHLRSFESLILDNESMYPRIETWYKEKVLPGIKNHERAAFVAYLDQTPIVSAVVKKAARSKICHLRLHRSLQNAHIGEVIFCLMVLEIRDFANELHFTIPESVWVDKGDFFTAFGFTASHTSERQYRLFDRELYCSAPFSQVWGSVLDKLPKLTSFYAFGGVSPESHLVLSLTPANARRILAGQKRIEIRRKFSTRWIGHRMNLYSSSPEMSLVGEASVSGVVSGSPDEIWNRFGLQIGCTKQEFATYVSGAGEVYAIELEDVCRYKAPIGLAQISYLLREQLRPPQSYFSIEKNRSWAKAVSLVAYLHASLKSVTGPAVTPRYFRAVRYRTSTDSRQPRALSTPQNGVHARVVRREAAAGSSLS